MLERRFPRRIDSLDAVFAFVAQFLRERGIDPERAFELDLIAEELFTNMVKYGGGNAEVSMTLRSEGDVVTLVLRDFDGRPYDVTRPAPLPAETAAGEPRAGGRGLHLVQRLADRLDYHHDGRVGTITVTKRLSA